jgi:uncharacterized Tic20 family protein
VAAFAHLGIPIYGPLLPLIVRAVSKDKPFRREHASQALAYQLCFYGLWLILTVLCIIYEALPMNVMGVVAVLGFLLEVPQVARALRGQPPFHLTNG